jgi:hypothetical protein
MPRYRFVGNRLTTILQNLFLGSRFTEMHSGMRAYTRQCLLSIPFLSYSDDFAFDSQFLVDSVTSGQRVVEVPIPTRYTKESSSISVIKSLRYIGSGIAYTLKRTRQRGRRGRRWPVTQPAMPDAAPPVARAHNPVHDHDVEAMERVLGGFVLPGERVARWPGASGSNGYDGLVITEHIEGLSMEAWDEARAAVHPEGLIVCMTELDGPSALSVLDRAGLRAVDWRERTGRAHLVAARVS